MSLIYRMWVFTYPALVMSCYRTHSICKSQQGSPYPGLALLWYIKTAGQWRETCEHRRCLDFPVSTSKCLLLRFLFILFLHILCNTIASHFSSKLWQIVWARDRWRQEAPSGARSLFLVNTAGVLVFYMDQAVAKIFSECIDGTGIRWSNGPWHCLDHELFQAGSWGALKGVSFFPCLLQFRQPVAYGLMIHKDDPGL